MPPVAATLPAASDAKLVVSRFPTSPCDAISWPSLSTRKTTLAEASIRNRARTALIRWYCCSRNRIGVSAIVRLFVEGRGRDFLGELSYNACSADCKLLKLKEVTYSVGALCRGGLSLRKPKSTLT